MDTATRPSKRFLAGYFGGLILMVFGSLAIGTVLGSFSQHHSNPWYVMLFVVLLQFILPVGALLVFLDHCRHSFHVPLKIRRTVCALYDFGSRRVWHVRIGVVIWLFTIVATWRLPPHLPLTVQVIIGALLYFVLVVFGPRFFGQDSTESHWRMGVGGYVN